jgi:drug/metabolite transporter (DMT)-like permease
MSWPPPSLPAGPARVAIVALLLGAVIIAFSGIFAKLSELGPSATAFHRFFIALPILWLWLSVGTTPGPKLAQMPRDDRRHLMLAGLFLGFDIAVWHWALKFGSVINGTLLGNTAPVWVVIFGWLLFGRRFTRLFLVGLALSIGGTAILVGGSFTFSPDHVIGDGLGLVAGALYAAYIMALGHARQRHSTITIMAWTSLICSAVLLPMALISGESLLPETWRGLAILLGLAILVQVIGHSIISWAMAHLAAPFASVTLLVNPIATMFLAWLILGETIGPPQYLGGAIVLAGIFLARLGSAEEIADKASLREPTARPEPGTMGPQ